MLGTKSLQKGAGSFNYLTFFEEKVCYIVRELRALYNDLHLLAGGKNI